MPGLLLPVTLARHLGLPQLVQQYLDLGNAPGRANTGDKVMTLVASALARGDCIDDADGLRTGRDVSLCIFPNAGPGKPSSVTPWHDCKPCLFQPDGGNQPADPRSAQLNVLANSRQLGPRGALLSYRLSNSAHHGHRGPPSSCLCGYLTPPSSSSIGIRPGLFAFPYPSSLVSTPAPIASVDSG